MEVEKQIREIIEFYCGGTYENRNTATKEILQICQNLQLQQTGVITSFNDILGLSEPYSLDSVLEKLIEASEILLHQKNYDGHGWEIISEAVTQARNYKNKIDSYLRQINE